MTKVVIHPGVASLKGPYTNAALEIQRKVVELLGKETRVYMEWNGEWFQVCEPLMPVTDLRLIRELNGKSPNV